MQRCASCSTIRKFYRIIVVVEVVEVADVQLDNSRCGRSEVLEVRI